MAQNEEVCMEIQRCQRGREAYQESCQRQGVPVLDAIVARFHTPASTKVCLDPNCPVYTMDANTDDAVKRSFLESHPDVHICRTPNCARRTDKHWFHLRSHIHLDGMVFLAAHSQYLEPQILSLALALKCHGNVREIKMNQCGITDTSAAALLTAISTCNTEGVELFKNNFSSPGLPPQPLASLLNTVRTLKLNGNNLGDEGVKTLAMAITPTSPIRELYLNVTFVSDEGIGVLKNALQHNGSISVLGLRENNISAVGAAHLSDVLGGGCSVFCQCWNILGSVQQGNELHYYCSCGETVKYTPPAQDPAVPTPNHPTPTKHNPYSCAPQEIGVHCRSPVHQGNGFFPLGSANTGGVPGTATWYCHKCQYAAKVTVPAVNRPHPTITELQLRGNQIDDLGAIALSKGLIHNKVLGSLELRRTNLSHIGIKALLEHGKELTALNLNDNNLHDEGAGVLAEYLPQMKLRTLGIQRAGINKKGGILLCESIKKSPSLTGIDISMNQLGDAFAEHLSAILAETSLESLDVNTCRIHQTGAIALARALQAAKPPRITHLDFSNNFSLGQAGGEWANTIEKNASLVRLSLTANSMDHQSMVKILEGLKKNTTLTSVHLYGRSDGAPDQFANHSLPEARKYLSTRKDKIGAAAAAAAAGPGAAGGAAAAAQAADSTKGNGNGNGNGAHGGNFMGNLYARMGLGGPRGIPISAAGNNNGSPMRHDIHSSSPPPPLSNSPCLGNSPLQGHTPPDMFANSPPNHSAAMRIEPKEEWEAEAMPSYSPINQTRYYGMLKHLTPDKTNDYLGFGVSYKASTESISSSMPALLDSLASSID